MLTICTNLEANRSIKKKLFGIKSGHAEIKSAINNQGKKILAAHYWTHCYSLIFIENQIILRVSFLI